MDGPRCQEAFTPPQFDERATQEEEQDTNADDVLASFDFSDVDMAAMSPMAPQLMPPSINSLDDSWWAEARQWQVALAAGQGSGQPVTTVESIDAASTQLILTKDGGHHVGGKDLSSGGDVSCKGKESEGSVSKDSVVANNTVSKEATLANETAAQAEEDAKLLAKRLKAQRRRERNRACAQRSNQRAKENRDRLIASLKECKEQVEVLRAKELELRKENLKLRKSFAELS